MTAPRWRLPSSVMFTSSPNTFFTLSASSPAPHSIVFLRPLVSCFFSPRDSIKDYQSILTTSSFTSFCSNISFRKNREIWWRLAVLYRISWRKKKHETSGRRQGWITYYACLLYHLFTSSLPSLARSTCEVKSVNWDHLRPSQTNICERQPRRNSVNTLKVQLMERNVR